MILKGKRRFPRISNLGRKGAREEERGIETKRE